MTFVRTDRDPYSTACPARKGRGQKKVEVVRLDCLNAVSYGFWTSYGCQAKARAESKLGYAIKGKSNLSPTPGFKKLLLELCFLV